MAVLTAGLASGLTDAASADLLRGLSADGVFRQVSPLPEGRLLRGERGYDLLPDQFGGHWSVVLGGPAVVQAGQSQMTQGQASSVQFTYLGAGDSLENYGPTVARLLGRMVGRAAGTCFSLGAERLPELKTWVESSLRASQDRALERKFGALKVQVLVHAQPGADATQGHTEVDVLLRRSGTPGTSGWTSTCQK